MLKGNENTDDVLESVLFMTMSRLAMGHQSIIAGTAEFAIRNGFLTKYHYNKGHFQQAEDQYNNSGTYIFTDFKSINNKH